MNPKHILGRYGEDRAAQYLTDRGYEIIERNWRKSNA
jgi:putative endonuclease